MESRAQLSESYCRKSVDESLPELQRRWPTKESLLTIIKKGERHNGMLPPTKKEKKINSLRHKKKGVGEFPEGALKC